MKSRFVFVLLFTCCSLGVFAQQNEDLQRHARRLIALGFDMVECREDHDRQNAAIEFNSVIDSLIAIPGSHLFAFDSVRNVRVLYSPDRLFRILTWGFRHPNDSFVFFGYIQFLKDAVPAIWLADSAHQLGNNDISYYAELTPENWHGAMYYQIEKIKYRRQAYYLLLGWNGNTVKSDRKILEVLRFSPNGEPVFGLPVFDMNEDKAPQNRVIWEYKNGASMALRVEPDKKFITFEHIVPASPNAKGIYSLYLPDGTYDYFEFKKGIWKKGSMFFERFF